MRWGDRAVILEGPTMRKGHISKPRQQSTDRDGGGDGRSLQEKTGQAVQGRGQEVGVEGALVKLPDSSQVSAILFNILHPFSQTPPAL